MMFNCHPVVFIPAAALFGIGKGGYGMLCHHAFAP